MAANTERPAVFPFFTGCQRSGTTLLRVIFNQHPSLAIPGESHFIPPLARRRRRYESAAGFSVDRFVDDLRRQERFRTWKIPDDVVRRALTQEPPHDFPDAIRGLYSLVASRRGKPGYADKTPRYATEIPLLAELFPESRFVHVIRDGREVALSLIEMPWGPNRTDRGALYWRDRVRAARDAGRALGPARYLEYKHQDLVQDPEAVVRTICAFLDLEFHPRMLRYHERRKPAVKPQGKHLHKPPTAGLRDFRIDMTPQQLRVFELLAGDLLVELGFELATDAETLPAAGEGEARAKAARARRRHRLRTWAPMGRLLAGPLGRPTEAVYRTVMRVAGRQGDDGYR